MDILKSGLKNTPLIPTEDKESEFGQVFMSGIEPDVENLLPFSEEPIESLLVDETQSEEPVTTNDDTDVITGIKKGEPNIVPEPDRVSRKATKTDPGNNAKNALNLGKVGDDPITRSDNIGINSGGTKDRNDYYKFTLTGKENDVSILVDGLKDNANVELRDTNGQSVLSKSTEKGKKAETIDIELDKGDYFLRVYPQGNAKTQYDLTISADEILPDPDSKPSGATNLGKFKKKKEETVNDKIGFKVGPVRDNSDFYKFTLTEELNSVNVVLDDLKANANITLFDEDGETTIDQSREKGKLPETIDQFLTAGDYYLEVTPQGSAKTKYQLNVDSEQVKGDPDGTLKKAREIEVGEEPENIRDRIGYKEIQRDQKDYYKFKLKKESEVNITLDDLNQNADLDLLDKKGGLLFSSSEKGKTLDEITSILEPDTYHILVKPFGSAKTDYNLSIDIDDRVKDPDGEIPGKNLGKLKEDEIKVNDKIGFQESGFIDANDYSNFELTEETNVTLQLDGLKQNADLELYDTSGTLLNISNNKGKVSEEITATLDAGTYYTRVKKMGSSKTKYSLSLSGDPYNPDPDGDIPGNNLGTIGKDPATASDRVGFSEGGAKDFQDYYNFTLTEESEVNIVLDGLTGNGELELIDSDKKTLLGESDNAKKKSETIDETLEAGKYYVRVAPGGNGGGKTKYNLEVSATADSGGDYDTPETAKELGNLNNKVTIDEDNEIGFTEGSRRDLNDYYSFKLTKAEEVNLTLDKLKGNANLQLLAEDGKTEVDRSENTGKKREGITQELEVGTYYARVFPSGTAKTAYELNLEISPDEPTELIKPIKNVTVEEDAANKRINLSNHFTDSDSKLTYEVVSNSNNDLVTTKINGNKLTLDFLENQHGNANIEVKATGDGEPVSDTFKVTVNPVDDEPTVTPIEDFAVNEDADNTGINLLSVFNDIDSTLSFATPSNNNPGLVTATVDGNNLVLDYVANASGAAEITLTATGDGVDVTDSFVATVNPVDDPPVVANPMEDFAVNEDAANTEINLSNVFSDIDSTLSFASSNSNPGLVTATVDANNNLVLDYVANASGAAEITVTATGDGIDVTDTLSVTVNTVDDAPTVANAIADVAANEDAAPTAIDVSNVFTDIDNDDSAITKAVTANSNSGLVTPVLDGNNLTFTYAPNASGVAEITVEGTSNGLKVTDTFTVTVAPVDDPTLLVSPVADLAVDEDADNTGINLLSVFSDIDSTLTFATPSNSNAGLVSATVDGNNLVLDYVANQSGTAEITLTATGDGVDVTDTFVATVNPVDDPPVVASPIADLVVNEDAANTEINLSSVFSDIDSALTFATLSNSNDGLVIATVVNNNLVLDYVANQSGTAEITVSGESNSQTVNDTFVVTVNAVDDPTVLTTEIADIAVEENATSTAIDLSQHFADPDNAITYSLTANSTNGLINPVLNGSNLTLNYATNQPGTTEITVAATGGGSPVTDTFTVNINPTLNPVAARPSWMSYLGSDNSSNPTRGGRYYNDYLLDGVSPGEIVTVDMISSFDTYLQLVNARTGTLIASDDDGGSGANSRFSFTVAPNVDYLVRSTSYSSGITGFYNVMTSPGGMIPLIGDEAPVVANAIADVVVNEDGAPTTIDLSNVFTDIDNDNTAITKVVAANSNSDLVNPVLNGNNLTLNYAANQFGVSQITVEGMSNGRTVSDTFAVTVNPVDDAPTVANAIADVVVDENAAPTTIDLSNVFTDIDNDDTAITKAVTVSNPGLVTPVVDGNNLTLNYAANQYGVTEITVEGTSNGQSISDTFVVTVNEVDAPTVLTTPIADIAVYENATSTPIDLSQHFADADDDIVYAVTANSNSGLVNPTINGGNLTLNYGTNQSGTTEITVQATGGGTPVSDTFTVTVNQILGLPSLTGSLSSSDGNNPTRSSRYYDDYLLSGVSPGEQVTLDMSASFDTYFDTYLQLVNAQTGALITYNDDGGSGTNSRLTFTVAPNVDYLVRATSYSSRITGTYTVETSQGGMIPAITSSQSLSGSLSSSTGDNPTRSGSYYDDYALAGLSSGERVTVDMSASFDTYLQLVNARTGELITYNDDGGPGVNSRLSFTVAPNIDYLIRATSFRSSQTGTYTLSVS